MLFFEICELFEKNFNGTKMKIFQMFFSKRDFERLLLDQSCAASFTWNFAVFAAWNGKKCQKSNSWLFSIFEVVNREVSVNSWLKFHPKDP